MNEHIIAWEPGYDCGKFECRWDKKDCHRGGDGFHGRHGLGIRFVSKGPLGAVQFHIHAGWLPMEVTSWERRPITVDATVMPTDLGVHAKEPQYEGQSPMDKDCTYTDGPCYYDGCSLNAWDPYTALVNGGIDALWKFLDEYYECAFHDEEYPTPAAYMKPLRSLRDAKKPNHPNIL